MQPYGNNAAIGGSSALYTVFSVKRPAGNQSASKKSSQRGQQGNLRHRRGAEGCEAGFLARHAEITADSVVDYLVRDPLNPSSIVSCFKTARRNARTIRTTLTTDMWTSISGTWMQIEPKLSPDLPAEQIAESLKSARNASCCSTAATAPCCATTPIT